MQDSGDASPNPSNASRAPSSKNKGRSQPAGSVFIHASESEASNASITSGIRKRAHINVACNACRARKYKCNGDRPVCTGCQDRGSECVYEVEANTTRLASLKRKQVSLELENEEMQRLVQLLRTGPKEKIEIALRYLQSGHELEYAMQRANEGPSSSQPINTTGGPDGEPVLAALTNWLDSQVSQLPLEDTSSQPSTGDNTEKDERMSLDRFVSRIEDDKPPTSSRQSEQTPTKHAQRSSETSPSIRRLRFSPARGEDQP